VRRCVIRINRILGAEPTDQELNSYLEAYFGDRLSSDRREHVIASLRKARSNESDFPWFDSFVSFLKGFFETSELLASDSPDEKDVLDEAHSIAFALSRSTEELSSVMEGLNGGYVKPAPGGGKKFSAPLANSGSIISLNTAFSDLLRDGPSVLPTGRNIHALDPYRMPSAGAWARGQLAAAEIIKQHQASNEGKFPETVAVTLWGLDAIKTRGESVAIVLALVGAKPVKEGTGRIVRYDLIPLEELGRPRIDVLASMSGIFR
jgi:magnesium chelatase subunit H